MPSFQDSAVLIVLALLLFGPKKLPVLARQLGKLMGDFRRASNEFRTQMEEELRIAEQADRQKEVARLEAAAAKPEQPHQPPAPPTFVSSSEAESAQAELPAGDSEAPDSPAPIASSGELSILPPATGLPVANTSMNGSDSPAPQNSAVSAHETELETETLHG